MRHLSPPEGKAARRHLIAETVRLGSGASVAALPSTGQSGPLVGHLILEGLLKRRVAVHGRGAVELLGSGDLLRPWQAGDDLASVPAEVSWQVCEPARVALLDRSFEVAAARWPGILVEVVARTVERANSAALLRTLPQIHPLGLRVLTLLWHLSDRWGVVEATGRVMPLRLTQATLAELVGARRPSVCAALRWLANEGSALPLPGGGWLLPGKPPRADGTKALSVSAT